MGRVLKALMTLGALAALAACSKFSSPSIIGHWRAERVQIFSAQIPVGPEIVVSETEISSPGSDITMLIHGFEPRSDQVTVDFDYGMGVTFYFDGPDRIYLKVPSLGKVYYRRVEDSASLASVPPSESVVGQPQSKSTVARATVMRGQSNGGITTTVRTQTASVDQRTGNGLQSASGPSAVVNRAATEYQMASKAAREGQTEAAIDHLNNAFKAGFRDVAQLTSSPEFSLVANDVRFQALAARYR